MARWGGPVLVDTNAIIEAWRVNAWRALRGGYALETVDECVTETQTGFQRRRKEQQIDRETLLGDLKAVHTVSKVERASALLRDGEIAMLDAGEKALWAHALARSDVWVLCAPRHLPTLAGVSDRHRGQIRRLAVHRQGGRVLRPLRAGRARRACGPANRGGRRS
ncbi:MAG: hypothetical protein WAN86_08435 [Hyphomicrobiaceae bacterium]